jgi:hypothetical protein
MILQPLIAHQEVQGGNMVDIIFKKSEDKLPRKLQLKGYKYVGYSHDFDQLFFAKDQENNNVLFASVGYAADTKKFLRRPTLFLRENTKISLLDSFMTDYLASIGKPMPFNFKVVSEDTITNDEIRAAYTQEIPKAFKNYDVKRLQDKGYSVLYVCDTTKLKSRMINTLDIYFVKQEEVYVVFESLHFVESPDYIKTKKGDKWVQLQSNSIVVPTNVLNK